MHVVIQPLGVFEFTEFEYHNGLVVQSLSMLFTLVRVKGSKKVV